MNAKNFDELNVLLALPNQQIAHGITNALRTAGVKRIKYAPTSKEALSAMAQTGRVNLFFLSSNLKPHGGVDFARFIRLTNSPMSKADVIVHLTGDVTKEMVLEARNSGVSAIMIGDVTGAQLQKQIEQIITNRKLFITCDNYTGPDRRRPNPPAYAGAERRKP